MSTGSTSFSTSLSLIRRVQARDPESWDLLAKLYGPLVYRWCRVAGLSPVDAPDVVQNVFLLLFRKLDRFSPEHPQASFRGWLWTVTRNAILEYRRKQSRHPSAVGGSAAFHELQQQAEEILSDELRDPEQDEGALLQRALRVIEDSVDKTTWLAFWRSAVRDEPAREIAADLGVTAHSIRQAKYRILCRLRELLADK
ncbi:RNA polymerase sigma factor [Planctomicrobium piriforme]|uniref:RNA polymerase sigma factor, sigma-70 family n=1 Tax=Planctomicrobium piriforme TaxID=1576369 RepID=A0A1I3B4V4_9PLAN|nr:sigma-70 family RNA polymerase sigma factor [Planctomicrobium piriforme]SFH57327.1 RNA polymerase sigma factor, sigma-70 family [Planctomicrobium piriforme]